MAHAAAAALLVIGAVWSARIIRRGYETIDPVPRGVRVRATLLVVGLVAVAIALGAWMLAPPASPEGAIVVRLAVALRLLTALFFGLCLCGIWAIAIGTTWLGGRPAPMARGRKLYRTTEHWAARNPWGEWAIFVVVAAGCLATSTLMRRASLRVDDQGITRRGLVGGDRGPIAWDRVERLRVQVAFDKRGQPGYSLFWEIRDEAPVELDGVWAPTTREAEALVQTTRARGVAVESGG